MWEYLRSLRHGGPFNRPIPYVDPLYAGRHPFQTYMLALCVVAGIPYLFGEATAEAVEKQLPVWIAYGWGVFLVVGSVTALFGSWWRGKVETALTMERVGLYLTGIAALIYALCVLGGRSAIAPILVVLIWIGVFLLRVPLPQDLRYQSLTENFLTVLGLIFVTVGAAVLPFTPALIIAAGAAIILGFGLACLRRARDIARVFHRAKEISQSKATVSTGV